tara:strand:- start:24 stop:836 length:813 start_codon:yes stop_codon:yes gene_type:complete
MGNKQSITQDFNMSSLNKSIQTSLSENSAKASASSENAAMLQIKIGRSKNCPITTSQKISSKTVSSTKNMSETLTDMKSDITNELQQTADSKLKNLSGALSTEYGSKTALNQKVNTSIKNVVEKTLSAQNISDTLASSANIIGGKIEIGFMECSDGKGLDMTQDITSELVATAVTDSLAKNLLADKTLTKVAQSAEAVSVVEKRGPLESAGAMLSGIFGSLTYIYALCACVFCCACAGLVYVLLSPAGQTAVTTVANTGSAIVKAKTGTF